jgi:hypothetical protein
MRFLQRLNQVRSMENSSKDEEAIPSKGKVWRAWYSYDAALLATFLTLTNGAGGLIAGIETFARGGQLLAEEAMIQTTVGGTVFFFSLVMLGILFSRLKVQRFL